VTVLLVSHELNIVSKFVDHVLCLKDGRVACEGPPQQVLTGGMVSEIFGADRGIYSHQHGITTPRVVDRPA
jgi:ABC-type hemin transport system ATPase subunit